jgi:hypothetical protein
MPDKKDQHKVGAKAKPRGQQMGTASAPDQNRAQKAGTPALSGRRKTKNKMFGDKSAQNIGGDAVTPQTNSPSTPAMTSRTRKGESSGETAFKARLKNTRAATKRR